MEYHLKRESIMKLSIGSDATLLGKIVRFPLRLIPRSLVIFILQGKLRGKKWVVGSGVHACWLGDYEYGKQSIFQEAVGQGNIVFDIGANVGFYTLLASILVGPLGKVFAFEPVPKNLLYLKRHIQLNRLTNVSIIEAAVSDHNGFARFDEGITRSEGYISSEGNLFVRTVGLDELYLQGKILIPDFMKIDVEGAEMSVLRGAKSILQHFHPVIFLSTHGEYVHQQCIGFLKSIDYKIKTIDGKKISHPDEIVAYT
jgi:FkbM family methyltransferase